MDLYIRDNSEISVRELILPDTTEYQLVPYDKKRIALNFTISTGGAGNAIAYPRYKNAAGLTGLVQSTQVGQVVNNSLFGFIECEWYVHCLVTPQTLVVMERIMSRPLEELLREYQQKYGR